LRVLIWKKFRKKTERRVAVLVHVKMAVEMKVRVEVDS